MTFKKARNLITSIACNLDGGIKYSYELIPPERFELKMYDSKREQLRVVTFKLKKGNKKMVYVKFACHGFRFNFPLKKKVESMSFNVYNFAMLLENGIKTNESTSDAGLDLDVAF